MKFNNLLTVVISIFIATILINNSLAGKVKFGLGSKENNEFSKMFKLNSNEGKNNFLNKQSQIEAEEVNSNLNKERTNTNSSNIENPKISNPMERGKVESNMETPKIYSSPNYNSGYNSTNKSIGAYVSGITPMGVEYANRLSSYAASPGYTHFNTPLYTPGIIKSRAIPTGYLGNVSSVPILKPGFPNTYASNITHGPVYPNSTRNGQPLQTFSAQGNINPSIRKVFGPSPSLIPTRAFLPRPSPVHIIEKGPAGRLHPFSAVRNPYLTEAIGVERIRAHGISPLSYNSYSRILPDAFNNNGVIDSEVISSVTNENKIDDLNLIKELSHINYLSSKNQFNRLEKNLIEILEYFKDKKNITNLLNNKARTKCVSIIAKVKNSLQSQSSHKNSQNNSSIEKLLSEIEEKINNREDIKTSNKKIDDYDKLDQEDNNKINKNKNTESIDNKNTSLNLNILKWAQQHHIVLSNSSPRLNPKTKEVGLFSNSNITRNTDILTISKSNLLYEDHPLIKGTCLLVKSIPELNDNYDKICLSVFLIKSLIKGRFKEYADFNINQTDYTAYPMFYSQKHIKMLDNTFFKGLVSKRKKIFTTEYSHLKQKLNFRNFTLENYIKARLSVLSKNFLIEKSSLTDNALIKNKQDNSITESSNASNYIDIKERNYCVIAPISELITNSLNPNSKFSINKGKFVIISTKNIKQNSEIHLYFGNMSNYQYLLYYGTTIPNNETKIEMYIKVLNQNVLLSSKLDLNSSLHLIRKEISDAKRNSLIIKYSKKRNKEKLVDLIIELKAIIKLNSSINQQISHLNKTISNNSAIQINNKSNSNDSIIFKHINRIINEELSRLTKYFNISSIYIEVLLKLIKAIKINEEYGTKTRPMILTSKLSSLINSKSYFYKYFTIMKEKFALEIELSSNIRNSLFKVVNSEVGKKLNEKISYKHSKNKSIQDHEDDLDKLDKEDETKMKISNNINDNKGFNSNGLSEFGDFNESNLNNSDLVTNSYLNNKDNYYDGSSNISNALDNYGIRNNISQDYFGDTYKR